MFDVPPDLREQGGSIFGRHGPPDFGAQRGVEVSMPALIALFLMAVLLFSLIG